MTKEGHQKFWRMKSIFGKNLKFVHKKFIFSRIYMNSREIWPWVFIGQSWVFYFYRVATLLVRDTLADRKWEDRSPVLTRKNWNFELYDIGLL